MSVSTDERSGAAGGSGHDGPSAFPALAQLLGEANVKADDATLCRYGRSSSPHDTRPLAVVYPESTAQVQQLVELAGRTGLKLYPISRGKNWGYGDACAPTEGQVIVDLGRMNRIVELNRELGYVVIEPGVTQKQLYEHLQTTGSRLWMDATGAGVESSLVGNTLDRGFGHTPYGDHFLSCCGMEVVLGDGRILNTGFGHFPNAKATHVYRYGVGPFLDGLFAQSNYGIVTRIGLWLMPEPEDFAAFFLFVPEEEGLEQIIDRLAPLRLSGMLRSAIHIANDLRVLSARTRYPFHLTGGQTPLPSSVRQQLRREYRMGAWNCSGAICGTREVVAATRRAVKRALSPIKAVFIDDRRLAMANRLARWFGKMTWGQRLADQLQTVEPLYGLLKGIPTNEPMHGACWRVRDPKPVEPVEPLDCHAGLMWVSPIVPTSSRCAREVVNLIEPIYSRYGFDTLVTFTMITERALCCITNVAYDQRYPDEAAKAAECYDELYSTLIAAGYPPYRTSAHGVRRLTQNASVFWDVTRQLKQALDPQGVIAPGRYVPG